MSRAGERLRRRSHLPTARQRSQQSLHRLDGPRLRRQPERLLLRASSRTRAVGVGAAMPRGERPNARDAAAAARIRRSRRRSGAPGPHPSGSTLRPRAEVERSRSRARLSRVLGRRDAGRHRPAPRAERAPSARRRPAGAIRSPRRVPGSRSSRGRSDSRRRCRRGRSRCRSRHARRGGRSTPSRAMPPIPAVDCSDDLERVVVRLLAEHPPDGGWARTMSAIPGETSRRRPRRSRTPRARRGSSR